MSSNDTVPTSGNPYAPQEPAALVLLEQCDFAGTNISEIFYGATIVLFFSCMRALLWPRHGRKRNFYLAGYTLAIFSLGTIFVAMNVHLTQLSFIDNRNFPGGPESYALAKASTVLAIVPNACFVISNWLADGLLLYRCKVIWTGKPWILALPVTMYLGSMSMGIAFLYQSSSPNSNLFVQSAVDFGLPYFSLSCSLNVLLTFLISLRLVLHQRRMVWNEGSKHRNLPYNAIVGMLVESSALYAIFSLLFLGTYAAGSGASDIFLPILSQTQIIAPLLIISRVASQRAYTSDVNTQSATKPSTAASPRELRFSPGTTDVDSFPLEESPKFSTFEGSVKGKHGIIVSSTTNSAA